MKKHIVALFGFALLLAAASAHAQITDSVRVSVPFPFVVAGHAMPAANYTVKITQSTGLIIMDTPGHSAMVFSNRNDHPGRYSSESSLKFERYGNSWVLEQVTYDGTEQRLHPSQIEQQLAQLKPSGERTLLASTASGH